MTVVSILLAWYMLGIIGAWFCLAGAKIKCILTDGQEVTLFYKEIIDILLIGLLGIFPFIIGFAVLMKEIYDFYIDKYKDNHFVLKSGKAN